MQSICNALEFEVSATSIWVLNQGSTEFVHGGKICGGVVSNHLMSKHRSRKSMEKYKQYQACIWLLNLKHLEASMIAALLFLGSTREVYEQGLMAIA